MKKIKSKLLIVLCLVLLGMNMFIAIGCGGNKMTIQSKNEYIFCAAYVNLDNVEGIGWSTGKIQGTDLIGQDSGKILGTSEGYFVTNLYMPDIVLKFYIDSDKDINDARITLRLSAQYADYDLTNEYFQVKVNGTELKYDDISFHGTKESEPLPFKDYIISKSGSLQKGKNTIELVVNNNISFGGVTKATAPIIDCLKVKTSAKLSWQPIMSNVEEL